MAAIGIVSEGLGNKVWMLVTHIHNFEKSDLKDLYIFYKKSKHEEQPLDEIFPKLRKLKWLHFIYDWKEYDSIKKEATVYDTSFDFNPEVFDIDLRILTMNPDFKQLLKKYDTKKGIVIHYRLGDKDKNTNYVKMKPEYFLKHIQKMLADSEGPVYLASDSMDKAVKLLGIPVIPIEEDAVSTFYLLTKFKRLILSESTFGIVARYLNEDCHAVIPEYKVSWSDHKLRKSPLLLETAFEVEKDKSFARL